MIEVLNHMRKRNAMAKQILPTRAEPNWTPPPEIQPEAPQDLDEVRDQQRIEGEISDLLAGMNAAPEEVTADTYGVKGIAAIQQSNTEKIIQLTAKAAIDLYEEAAKSIEQMRTPLIERANLHQQALDEIAAAVKKIEDTADQFRAAGLAASELYQKSSSAVANVNKTCDEVLKTIGRPE